ncbi:MAG: hypothetical protein M1834_001065 [Cirrosporium novae-zelandiae]|nr:MAG: hypothetical protein M1834_001065 [Cirrosporium novae-zelandiae]
MRFLATIFLLPALVRTQAIEVMEVPSEVVAAPSFTDLNVKQPISFQVQPTPAASLLVPSMPSITSAPAYNELELNGDGLNHNGLELREIVAGVVSSASGGQADAVTTYGINSGTAADWISVTYTQTFASVPDQWTTSGSGTVGLGTLTGSVGVVKEYEAGANTVMQKFTITLGVTALALVGAMSFVNSFL